MMSTSGIQTKRFCILALAAVIAWPWLSACTVKRPPVQYGFIPTKALSDPNAEKYGRNLFRQLRKDFELESNEQKLNRLESVFQKLVEAAQADHIRWRIYLLDGPDVMDIRAVYGNYLFVWSGILDAVENDDALAGLLAWEMAHALANHTDPVRFTIASEILFNAAELAATFGLMVASQGAIAIGGSGWMKSVYIDAVDLDSLDRIYSEAQEREAANIALLILSRADYSPQALAAFWKRVSDDKTLQDRSEPLSRGVPARDRAAMLEQLLLEHPPQAYPQPATTGFTQDFIR